MSRALLCLSMRAQSNFLLYQSQDIIFQGVESQTILRGWNIYSLFILLPSKNVRKKCQFPETHRKGNHKYVAVVKSRGIWDAIVVERDQPHKQPSVNSKTALFRSHIQNHALFIAPDSDVKKRMNLSFYLFGGWTKRPLKVPSNPKDFITYLLILYVPFFSTYKLS